MRDITMSFRNINGKQYKFVGDHFKKSTAKEEAKDQREKGYAVRVVKSRLGYAVYQRNLHTR